MVSHSVTVTLFKRAGRSSFPVLFRVSYGGQRVELRPGYSCNNIEVWDAEGQRFKSSAPEAVLNASISADLASIDKIFARYLLAEDRAPSPKELKEAFGVSIGRPSAVEKSAPLSFIQVFDLFTSEVGRAHEWSSATYKKFNTLKTHLGRWRKNLNFEAFDEAGLQSFVSSLHGEDLKNTSVSKIYKFLRWFLKWAINKGYCKNKAVLTWAPRLKGTDGRNKEVIFLSWDELQQFLNFEFPKSKNYLSAVRDVFCFCCFTGLRYSDAYKLKKEDIKEGAISVVTKKTADALRIELNKYSKAILEKWADVSLPKDAALPAVSNQKTNEYLKEAAKLAGLDAPQRIVYFKQSQRIEEIKPLYEIITSHCGRRTFVVNALRLGIPPAVIMSWTGHSDFKAMRPYIKIVNELKAENMAKFNAFEGGTQIGTQNLSGNK